MKENDLKKQPFRRDPQEDKQQIRREAAERLEEEVLSFFYPRRCPLCGQVVRPKGYLACPACLSARTRIGDPACFRCGKPLDAEEKEFCRDCAGKKFPFERCFALWPYDEEMKRSIRDFKYHGRREYSAFYVEQLLERYGKTLTRLGCEAVVPVPVHKSRLRERTYNQAELLAAGVAEALGVPMPADLLIRSRKTEPQKELDPEQRKRNLASAFEVNTRSAAWDRYWSRILLVDDIYTTGSTVKACAGVLRQACAGEVYVLCLCVGTGA